LRNSAPRPCPQNRGFGGLYIPSTVVLHTIVMAFVTYASEAL
jgi:hypothetical protein